MPEPKLRTSRLPSCAGLGWLDAAFAACMVAGVATVSAGLYVLSSGPGQHDVKHVASELQPFVWRQGVLQMPDSPLQTGAVKADDVRVSETSNLSRDREGRVGGHVHGPIFRPVADNH